MFSIFSNILRDRIRLICQACDRRPHTIEEYKLSDTVDLITPGDNIPHVIIPYDETEDWTDKILYEYCKNQSLRKVTQFVVDKILVDCDKMDYKTRNVRIRIFTGMLNKLVDNGNLDKTMAIKIHIGTIKNIRDLMSDLWTEDLPF